MKPSFPYGRNYFRSIYSVDTVRKFGRQWWALRMYACIADRWLRMIGGSRMLDAGCGQGALVGWLENRYETFGMDISEYAIEKARRNAPKSVCLVADLDAALPNRLERGTFDLVVARYVLEHLGRPLAAMKRLAELLRPGGIFFFSVPNTESLGARCKGEQWYARKDPTHCSLLPPENWLQMIRDAGLFPVREFSDGYWDLPYLSWLPGWLQAPFFAGPSALACLAGREILPARFGENILVIAEKKQEDTKQY